MKFVDVKEFKENSVLVLEYLKRHNVVITEHDKPIAIIKKFDGTGENSAIEKDILSQLVKSDESLATQYSAMMNVWGDPHCDIYDEAFKDD